MKPFRSANSFFLLAVCLVLVYSFPVSAGDDWLPVTAEELALKASAVEKDADAEYLFWEVRVDDSDGDSMTLAHYIRVKIFTDRGREAFAKVDISPSSVSKIKDVAGRVIRPDGSIVEIKKKDILERTVIKFGDEKVKARSFAIPENGVGAIIEYRYREVFSGGGANLDLYFQREYPARSISYLVRPFSGRYAMRYRRFNMPAGVDFVKEKKDYYRITMTNVPALHVEPMMPPHNEVRPWVMLYYSLEQQNDLPDHWARFGGQRGYYMQRLTEPTDEIKRVATEVTAGAATPEEKLLRLYEFCKTKIKNLSYDTKMDAEEKAKIPFNESAGETLQKQMGWHADIDRLFFSLARGAGFEPRSVYTGDRSNMFFTPQMTDSRLVRFAGIAVKAGERWHFYDPGSRFLPAGMLVWTAEGQDTLLTDANVITWVHTKPSSSVRSREKRTGKFRLLADGTLEGDVRLEYSGHMANARKTINYDDTPAEQEETLREQVKERWSTAEVSEIKLENVNEPAGPFVYDFKIRVPGYAQVTGKRLILQPGFFERGTSVLFTAAERRFDISFRYPWSEEDTITIEIPDGYVVDAAEQPPPITPELTKGIAGLKIKIAVSEDQRVLRYDRTYFFGGGNTFLFRKASYPELKKLFESIHLADDHSVILRQK